MKFFVAARIVSIAAALFLGGCASLQKQLDTGVDQFAPSAGEAGVLERPAHVPEPYSVTFDTNTALGDADAGSIVISPERKMLLFVTGYGEGKIYPIAVGREGFAIAGAAVVGEKKVDPTWTPPAEMIGRKPELERWANGMPGGIPENPLGTRAIYLYTEDGSDTLYRIHGTNDRDSIGTNASSGCIRMLNEDVEELFDRVASNARVYVLGDGDRVVYEPLDSLSSPEDVSEEGEEQDVPSLEI
jgi:lipoprotein-anchoring transpeptidase ErfK/SrfK